VPAAGFQHTNYFSPAAGPGTPRNFLACLTLLQSRYVLGGRERVTEWGARRRHLHIPGRFRTR